VIRTTLNSTAAGNPDIKPKKSHRLAIILLVCILASCILMIFIGLMRDRWNTDRDSTYLTYHYRGASIEAMVAACTEDFYIEPQPWMGLTQGTADVLIIDYAQTSPIPDANYAYDFYAQVDPELLAAGQELVIPGDAVIAILIETRAPHIYCTTQLTGRIQILDVTDMGVLRTWVDLTRAAAGSTWSYTAEVVFTNPPLP
jgi:hypothetical protein